MISPINSYNWYSSLFQSNINPQSSSQNSFEGITNIDASSAQSYEEQSMNLTQSNNAYNMLHNISSSSSFSGITNLDEYAQNSYQVQSNPSLSQAAQSYNNQNIYALGSIYNQTI